MTIANHRTIGTSILLIAGVAAAAAAVLMAVAPYCGSSTHLSIAVLAAGIDVGAVLSRRASVAIPLSVVKLIVVFTTTLGLYSCAPPRIDMPAPLVSQGFALSILWLSTPLSFLGAFLLRFAR